MVDGALPSEEGQSKRKYIDHLIYKDRSTPAFCVIFIIYIFKRLE